MSPPAAGAPLRLKAEDALDLEVISAALQDAVFKVADVAFDAKSRRFAVRAARFRWETARAGRRRSGLGQPGERVASLLVLEGALGVRSRRLRLSDPAAVASLLALRFEPEPEPPGGVVRLVLAGDGEIRVAVEALDATLTDLSAPWPAGRRPDHGDA